MEFNFAERDLWMTNIFNKYHETLENTLFEFMNISESETFSELKENDFNITIKRDKGNTIASLFKGEKHIITYTIYLDSEAGQVKRSRMVNDI